MFFFSIFYIRYYKSDYDETLVNYCEHTREGFFWHSANGPGSRLLFNYTHNIIDHKTLVSCKHAQEGFRVLNSHGNGKNYENPEEDKFA